MGKGKGDPFFPFRLVAPKKKRGKAVKGPPAKKGSFGKATHRKARTIPRGVKRERSRRA